MTSRLRQLFEEVEFEHSQPIIDDEVSFIVNEEVELSVPVIMYNESYILLDTDQIVYDFLNEENLLSEVKELQEPVEVDIRPAYPESNISSRHHFDFTRMMKSQDEFDDFVSTKPGDITNSVKSPGNILDPSKQDVINVKEAKYQGRTVQLGKPMAGDVKKYKVYVRDPQTGNIKKVNFGDKKLSIKRDDPKRRKNFRARHRCATAKDRTSARYWSCRMWSKKPVSKILKGK